MKKLKKDIQDDLIAPLQQKRLMKLNRFLSSKYVIAAIAIALALVMFLCGNYLFNFFTNLKYLIYEPEKCLGVMNFFILKKQNILFYIVLMIIVALEDIYFVYKLRTAYKDLNIQQKGSERWTTIDEIKEQYRSVPEKSIPFDGKGGVPVCWYENRIYIDDSPVNTLVLGITRAGKGETYTLPTIDIYSRSSQKPSIIALDPKQDEYAACYYPLTKRGYDVYLLNLDNPLKSMNYNPLYLAVQEYKAGRESEAELLCQQFCYATFHKKGMENTREPFFPEGSTNILFCLCWSLLEDNVKKDKRDNAVNAQRWEARQKAFETLSDKEKDLVRKKVKELDENKQQELLNFRYIPSEIDYVPVYENEKKITLNSAISLFLALTDVEIPQGKKTITALEIYFGMRPTMDKAKLRFASIKAGSANQKGNLYQYMSQQLTTYMLENVAKLTAKNTLSFEEIGFGKKPVAVFLSIPDYDDSLHILASTFIEQAYFALSKGATRSASKKCDRDVIFYLEEIGNMPEIKNLKSGITMGQSRGLKFILSLQSYSQLEDIYGEKGANTIIGNCGNQVYIKTDDLDTAKKFSGLIGNQTITNVSRMGAKLSINKTFTETYESKPLLNENELMDLAEKCCVIKRTMRRRDIHGNAIPREFPIYNHGKTAFKMRYEYMLDEFPSGIDIGDLPTGDNSQIDLSEYTFDVNAFFENMEIPQPQQMQEEQGGGSQSLQQQVYEKREMIFNLEKLKNSTVLVAEIPNGNILLNMLENLLHISVENLTIGQAITELEIAEAARAISEQNKENLLTLLAESEMEL